MNGSEFFETSATLSRTDISEIEKKLGVTFPQDFIMHYLNYNGGCPVKDTYHWKNGDSTIINAFYSLKYNGFANIETTYEDLCLVEHYLPLGIVPFANDDGGNFFCISARDKDFGKVYYFNNDHYDTENSELAMILIENTFTDFINEIF